MELFFNCIIFVFIVLILIHCFKFNNKEFFTCELKGGSESTCFKEAQGENSGLLKDADKKNNDFNKQFKILSSTIEKNKKKIDENIEVIKDLDSLK